nr:MAG TPA: hypothetical protein [Caudoviricetes sp.]
MIKCLFVASLMCRTVQRVQDDLLRVECSENF